MRIFSRYHLLFERGCRFDNAPITRTPSHSKKRWVDLIVTGQMVHPRELAQPGEWPLYQSHEENWSIRAFKIQSCVNPACIIKGSMVQPIVPDPRNSPPSTSHVVARPRASRNKVTFPDWTRRIRCRAKLGAIWYIRKGKGDFAKRKSCLSALTICICSDFTATSYAWPDDLGIFHSCAPPKPTLPDP